LLEKRLDVIVNGKRNTAQVNLSQEETNLLLDALMQKSRPEFWEVATDGIDGTARGEEKQTSKRIRTVGDLCDAFDFDEAKMNKRIGSTKERTCNSEFETVHQMEFSNITSIALDVIKRSSEVLLPSQPTALFRNILDVGRKRALKAGQTREPVSQFQSELSSKLKCLYHKCTQRSVSRRTIGAVMEYISPLLKNKKSDLPRHSAQQRKGDIANLLANGNITHNIERRQKKDECTVKDAVSFILCHENAQSLSWGTMNIGFDDDIEGVRR
jgi:hypothetical protein